MFKSLLTVLLVTVALAGCSTKETVKTESAPADRNVTINNPPPAPAQNHTTIINTTSTPKP
jgi:PBP1b-binding outer membrane lipoprotein LpoB